MLRLLKHEHWMQKQSGPKGELLISFVPRPGLVGDDRLFQIDPFLAVPEMEQVTIVPLDDEPEVQQQQQQNTQRLVQQDQQEKLTQVIRK